MRERSKEEIVVVCGGGGGGGVVEGERSCWLSSLSKTQATHKAAAPETRKGESGQEAREDGAIKLLLVAGSEGKTRDGMG